MSDALGDLLQRLVDAWQKSGRGLPRAPCDPDIEPFIWVGEPNADDWCAWRPLPKEGKAPLRDVVGGLPPLHESIHAYFDGWWFCGFDGLLGEDMLSFRGNPPGLEPAGFAAALRQEAAANDGRLDHVPIGIDNRSGLRVVVDNSTGEVSIEDWETGEHRRIAASLDDAFRRTAV